MKEVIVHTLNECGRPRGQLQIRYMFRIVVLVFYLLTNLGLVRFSHLEMQNVHEYLGFCHMADTFLLGLDTLQLHAFVLFPLHPCICSVSPSSVCFPLDLDINIGPTII